MNKKPTKAMVNVLVPRQIKLFMKAQANMQDVDAAGVWAEAAIFWLKSKGITVETPSEETLGPVQPERMTA